MKNLVCCLLMFGLLMSTPHLLSAQIDIKKKTEKAADDAVDDGLNAVKGIFKKKDKKKDKEKEEKETDEATKQNTDEDPSPVSTSESAEKQENVKEEKAELIWASYDFVSGDRVLFEDNQVGEENGEFPSRWDIHSGNVENARLGNDKVIMFRSDSYIMPLIENPGQDYLPDVFTLEFDCYFHENENYQSYAIYFYDKKNQKSVDIANVSVYWNYIKQGNFNGYYPGINTSSYSKYEGWKHVSLSFNKRALKVYLDDTRILNIPNISGNPTGISIWGNHNQYKDKGGYIKNIRIAEGGVKLYDRVMQDGKIIANGIRFDSGKATLKPESMGIINKIYDLMLDYPDINFSIEGHTDSDGDETSNLELSIQRALTVLDVLVAKGIDKSRLTHTGYGESKPVDTNGTPEGKANNRRVEFVKL